MQKYAANSRHADHTQKRQCFYLGFLCAKTATCSGVPKFAAYFRQSILEVRGKSETRRPDHVLALPRTAVLLPNTRLCSEVFNFPRTSGKRVKTEHPEAVNTPNTPRKQPHKRKNRLSAVPTDQAARTVARPLHALFYKIGTELIRIICNVWLFEFNAG